MANFIAAKEAHRKAESCRNVVAENQIVDVNTKRLFISEDISGKTLEDIVSDEYLKKSLNSHIAGNIGRRLRLLIER